MDYLQRVPLAIGLALAGWTAACAGAARPTNEPRSPSSASAEFEALYNARQDSLRMRFTEADVRFVNGMIVHHAQALLMARLAPARDAGPEIRVLTGRIINAQQDEIAIMQQWLRDRKLPVPDVHIDEKSLMVHGGPHDHAQMPGMLSPEQLKQLDAARGREFDRLFLTFMIQHHRGAVKMVYDLMNANGGQEDAVWKLASDIQADQETEIQRMEQMLAALQRGR